MLMVNPANLIKTGEKSPTNLNGVNKMGKITWKYGANFEPYTPPTLLEELGINKLEAGLLIFAVALLAYAVLIF